MQAKTGWFCQNCILRLKKICWRKTLGNIFHFFWRMRAKFEAVVVKTALYFVRRESSGSHGFFSTENQLAGVVRTAVIVRRSTKLGGSLFLQLHYFFWKMTEKVSAGFNRAATYVVRGTIWKTFYRFSAIFGQILSICCQKGKVRVRRCIKGKKHPSLSEICFGRWCRNYLPLLKKN